MLTVECRDGNHLKCKLWRKCECFHHKATGYVCSRCREVVWNEIYNLTETEQWCASCYTKFMLFKLKKEGKTLDPEILDAIEWGQITIVDVMKRIGMEHLL